ncbi:hypothetical protein ACFWF7_40135 [Nocardia sp. NPDC060256]
MQQRRFADRIVPQGEAGRYWMHNGGQEGYMTDVGVTEDGAPHRRPWPSP